MGSYARQLFTSRDASVSLCSRLTKWDLDGLVPKWKGAGLPDLGIDAESRLLKRLEEVWEDGSGQVLLHARLLAAKKRSHLDVTRLMVSGRERVYLGM